MAKTIKVLEGQTGQINIAATYENKPVNEKVTLDSTKSDFKGLLTPGELTNGTLSYVAKTPGVGACKLVFNYTGSAVKQGEGESFATRTIDVTVEELKLTYEITKSKFEWGDQAEYNTSFKLFANGVEIDISDPDVEYDKYSKLKMIYIYDFTQGLTIDLEEIPDFDYTEGREPFIDTLVIRYKGKVLEVPITFVVPKLLKSTIKPWGNDRIFGYVYDFPLELTYSDGSDPTPDITTILATDNEWLTVNESTKETTITKDKFFEPVETTQNWIIKYIQHGVECSQMFGVPLSIERGFSYSTHPDKVNGKVGDTGILEYHFSYHKQPDASQVEVDLTNINTNGILTFGTPDVSNLGSIKVPYTVVKSGKVKATVPFYKKETTPRLLLAEFDLNVDVVPEKIVATIVTPTSNTEPLTSGSVTVLLKYNTGELVTDAESVTYSTVAHSDVYSNVGSGFRVVDANAGKYAYNYTSGYNSGIGGVKFTVKTKHGNYTFDGPNISNSSQPLEITTDSTWLNKGQTNAKFVVTAKQKQSINGSPVPVTGTLSVSPGFGLSLASGPTGSGPWTIGLTASKTANNAVTVGFTVNYSTGYVTIYTMA